MERPIASLEQFSPIRPLFFSKSWREHASTELQFLSDFSTVLYNQ